MQSEIQKSSATPEPRLLDRVRNKMRLLHYSIRTESAYSDWITRFLRFHRKPDGSWRHPVEMGRAEITEFLTDLAVSGRVSASTQNQALSAILFLYKHILEINIGNVDAVRAKKSDRLPTVLSVNEVRLTLDQFDWLRLQKSKRPCRIVETLYSSPSLWRKHPWPDASIC